MDHRRLLSDFGVASGFPYYNIAFFFDYFRNDHGWTQQAITLGAPIAVLLTIWAGPSSCPRFSPRWLIRRRHRPDVRGVPVVRAPRRLARRVLRGLVRLHARLLPVGPDPAPDHPVALVQETPRPGDGASPTSAARCSARSATSSIRGSCHFLPYQRALEISGLRAAPRLACGDLRAARPAGGRRADA